MLLLIAVNRMAMFLEISNDGEDLKYSGVLIRGEISRICGVLQSCYIYLALS